MVSGVEISLISIITVFLTLYLLAVITNLVKLVVGKKPKEQIKPKVVTTDDLSNGQDSQEELVAIVTAAIKTFNNSK